jgi:hypothetical protein
MRERQTSKRRTHRFTPLSAPAWFQAARRPSSRVRKRPRPAAGHRATRSRRQPRDVGARAANSRHARISSASRSGKSDSISSALTPSASISRTSATRIRIPRTQGRPPHCRGLVVILASCCCLAKATSAPGGLDSRDRFVAKSLRCRACAIETSPVEASRGSTHLHPQSLDR